MTELAFRNSTVADVAALVPLVTSAYRGDASRVGWTTEADFLDGNRIDPDVLRADIERPRSRVVLAERGDALLACAHVAEEDGHGYFGMFRSEEHTSELQSLMRISYAVFCLKKKKTQT